MPLTRITQLFFFLLTFLVILTTGASSFAQSTTVQGYNLQTFRPPADDQGLFNLAYSSLLQKGEFSTGLFLNYSNGLLSAGNPVTGTTIRIVDSFLTGDFLFGYGLFDFMDVGIGLPVHFYIKERNFNTTALFRTAGIGDLRLDFKLQALEDKKWWPGIAFLSVMSFPTGERTKFTGDSTITEELRLVLDKGIYDFILVGNIGYRFINRVAPLNLVKDDELTFGGGVEYKIPLGNRSWHVGAEVFGSTVISQRTEISTPVEVIGGIRKDFKKSGISFRVAGGYGLTSGAGSPGYRVIGGVNYRFGKRRGDTKVHEVIYFKFDEDRPEKKEKRKIKDISKELADRSKRKISVEGHADSIGTRKYNKRLSESRAAEVADQLTQDGVEMKRIDLKWYGETKPTAPNTTKKGRKLNRRVEIRAE